MNLQTPCQSLVDSGARLSVGLSHQGQFANPYFARREEIPSTLAHAGKVESSILDNARELGWPEEELLLSRLVLREALTNAIEHGNKLDDGKLVRIVYRVSPQAMHVLITDEGAGFDPDLLPDPTSGKQLLHHRGRGVMFIKEFARRVIYHQPGNCVEFVLKPGSQ